MIDDPFAQQLNQWNSGDSGQQPQQQTGNPAPQPMPSAGPDKSDPFSQQLGQWEQEGKKPDPNDQGAFMAGVENFNRVFGNVAEGTIDLVARATGWQGLQNNVKEVHDNLQASADAAAQKHPVAAGVGTIAGLAGSTALPLGTYSKGAGLLEKIGQGAVAGMAYGGLNYAPNMQDRAVNAAAGGLLGATAPVAGEGFSKAGQNLTGLLLRNPEGMSNMAAKAISPKASAINDVNVINEAKQGIQKTLDNFVPSENNTIPPASKILSQINLSDVKTQDITTNPITSKYLSEINTSPALQNVADSNFAKLHQVQQNITNDFYQKVFNPLDSDAVAKQELFDAKKTISDNLIKAGDELGIDYKAIQQMGERKAIYQSVSNILKNTPDQKGVPPLFDSPNITQNKSIDTLYDTLAGTQNKQETFIRAVKSAGGDVENTKGMLNVLNTLRNNSVDELLSKEGTTKMSLGDSGLFKGTDKIMGSFVDRMVTGRYNNAVLKLMLSGPEFQAKLSKALDGGVIKSTLKKLSPLLNQMNMGTATGMIPKENTQEEPGLLSQP